MSLHTETTTLSAGGTPITEVTGNVFSALGFGEDEAAYLQGRSDLMLALRAHIEAQGWNQTEAAVRLGTTQPRVSLLMRGRFREFSLDALVTMAARIGLKLKLELVAT